MDRPKEGLTQQPESMNGKTPTSGTLNALETTRT